MKTKCRQGWRVALTTLVAITSVFPSLKRYEIFAQETSQVPSGARQLIVQVIAYYDTMSVPDVGAGFVVAVTRDSFYVATAAHVVARGSDTLQQLQVIFEPARDDSVPGRVRDVDRGLDLALITVPRGRVRGFGFRGLRLDRRGDVRSLTFRDPVSPVGCLEGNCWQAPARPDRFIYVLGDDVGFETSSVRPGFSGGVLFNRWWEAVGMVKEISPPRGYAISIDRVIDQVQAWGQGVGLKKPSIPRRGYRTTIEVVLLVPVTSAEDYFPDDRAPSGRATLSHQVYSVISIHGGALRLTRDRLAVTAGIAGVGLRKKWGRFVPQLFAEAGFGHVEGQYDAGSFFLAVTEGDGEQPVLMTLADDGLGAGFGASIEVILAPHTILEVLAGHWKFNRPENEPGLPAVPDLADVYIGAGLRLGF